MDNLNKTRLGVWVLLCVLPWFAAGDQEQCGIQHNGTLCTEHNCCSKWGFCGYTADYCCVSRGCQSNCWDCDSCVDNGGLTSRDTFNQMLKHRNDGGRQAKGLYAYECGSQANDTECPDNRCCSKWGFCGSTADYCCESKGCQSHCWDCNDCVVGHGGLISADTFNQMLKHRNDDSCPAKGFYTYDAFIQAAKSFPDFANTGDNATRKRELAAFFAQTSHQTTGGWATAPDGPYAWGYCFKLEQSPGSAYCAPSSQYPCSPGKQYYGRGPIQISGNYNYGQCGRAIGVDLLNNPDLLASDPVISFKAALWFWMTPQSPKPSCHDVITGRWRPSDADIASGRLPGYGTVTNIINGGLECEKGQDSRVASRIGFYKRYCDIFGVDYGSNLDCYSQRPFSLLLESL